MDQFRIPTDDCLLVSAIGQSRSLREAARLLERDPSQLVRSIQRISSEHGLLMKIKGRWTPTEKGWRIIRWAADSIRTQEAVIEEEPRFRISTAMWMAEQILVPNLAHLSRA